MGVTCYTPAWIWWCARCIPVHPMNINLENGNEGEVRWVPRALHLPITASVSSKVAPARRFTAFLFLSDARVFCLCSHSEQLRFQPATGAEASGWGSRLFVSRFSIPRGHSFLEYYQNLGSIWMRKVL